MARIGPIRAIFPLPGTPRYSYGIPYRGGYGLSSSGLFMKSLCSPLCGTNPLIQLTNGSKPRSDLLPCNLQSVRGSASWWGHWGGYLMSNPNKKTYLDLTLVKKTIYEKTSGRAVNLADFMQQIYRNRDICTGTSPVIGQSQRCWCNVWIVYSLKSAKSSRNRSQVIYRNLF